MLLRDLGLTSEVDTCLTGRPGVARVTGNSLGGGGRVGSGSTKNKQVPAQTQHIEMHQMKNWRAASFLTVVSREGK